MVAGGENVRAEIEQLVGDGGCQTESTGGVFRVDNHEIDAVAGDDVTDVFPYDATAGAAEHIADEEDAHELQGTGCREQGTEHWTLGRSRCAGCE